MATIDFSTVPSGVAISVPRVNELNANAIRLGDAFAARLQALMATFNEAKTRFSEEADKFVASTQGESRAAALQLTKQRLAQQVANLRRDLITSSANDRAHLLRQLQAVADEAAAIGAVLSSPAAMLGRMAAGEARKSELIAQLRGAGTVEMEGMARMAIMLNDVVLAAAVLLVVDRQPRDRRAFPPSEFAQRVMGKEFDAIDDQLKAVALALRSAIAANREFERGAPDPLTNISLAIARGALKRPLGDSEPVAA